MICTWKVSDEPDNPMTDQWDYIKDGNIVGCVTCRDFKVYEARHYRGASIGDTCRTLKGAMRRVEDAIHKAAELTATQEREK